MNHRHLLHALAATACLASPTLHAGQVEADFNDMYLGATSTRGANAIENNGNYNSGSGFLADTGTSPSPGDYDNNTGVPRFEAGDLPVPTGVSGFNSNQAAGINSPTGVVYGSGTGTRFRRHQERRFASPLTGNEIWFSFLYRLDGIDAEAQVTFNLASTTESDPSSTAVPAGGFSISMGGTTAPGALAINHDERQTPASLFPAAANLLYYDDRNNNGAIDGTETDLNGNGVIDGVEVGKSSVAAIKSHLVIGRILVNDSGTDTIDVWLDPADASSAGTLGTPTLTSSAIDEVTAAGLTTVSFEIVRDLAPTPTGGPYIDGGHSAIDHFRLSDNANAFDFVTGNVEADPKLVVAADSPSLNFNFRGVYGTGSPLTSAPLSVKLKNEGATQDITIQSISFQNGNSAGVFQITSAPSLPLTLNPGDSTTITMQASSGVFSTNFTETLLIDTDEDAPEPQDMAIPVAAAFFTAGSVVNSNPGLNGNYNNWVSDHFNLFTPPVTVAPGFNNTTGAVRLRGTGDVSGGRPDNLSQGVFNGAADWELACIFSPVDKTEFAKYTGASATGADRGFQVILQADQSFPQPANGTEGQWTDTANADAALINLAYFPAADDLGVFDGTTWQMLGLGPLTGSTDVRPVPAITTDTDTDNLDDTWEQSYFPGDLTQLDGDGVADFDGDGVSDRDEFRRGQIPNDSDSDNDLILDADDHAGDGKLDPLDGDTVHWYLVHVKGNGFGTGSATYTVSVSNPNTNNKAKVTGPLSHWSAVSGTSNTPGSYTFTTGDQTALSGGGGTAVTTSYWIDEVRFYSVQAPDPGLSIGTVAAIQTHSPVTTGTSTLAIQNTGPTANLTVSALNFADGTAFSSSQPLPLVIPPGTTVNVPIDYNAAGLSSPDNAEADVVSVVTDALPLNTLSTPLRAGTTTVSSLLPNWNFEVPGLDATGDTDTFYAWPEGTTVVDFGGLVPGSNTSARITASGVDFRATAGEPASVFAVRFPFAMFQVASGRIFNVHLRQSGNTDNEENVNLRIDYPVAGISNVDLYEGSAWVTIGTVPVTFSVDANADGDLNDGGDTKAVYTMELTGNGWGTASPTLGVKLIGTDGSTVHVDAQGLTEPSAFRAPPTSAGLRQVGFRTVNDNPRFVIDDVSVMELQALTGTADSITRTGAAITGSQITHDAGSTVTERGVVYSLNPNPTTGDSKVMVAGTTGSFDAVLPSLTPGQVYHVRAYAINGIGTAYGADVSFTTLNQLPAFAGLSVSGAKNSPTGIAEATILAKASDADGDPVTLSAVAATSAQGGTISRSGGTVTYTPATDFTGTDSFSITLSDGYGTSDHSITVEVGSDPLFTSPGNGPWVTDLPGGGKRVAFTGIPGRTYGIRRSIDLLNWTQIATATAAPDSTVTYDDPSPPQPNAFYRIAFPAE